MLLLKSILLDNNWTLSSHLMFRITHTTNQMFVVNKKSLMLIKAAFIWTKIQ